MIHFQSRTNSLPRRDRSLGANGPSNMSGSLINPRGRDYSLTRLGGVSNQPPFGRTGGNGPSWTDSMPRRDFYSNVAQTGSLPRRDKAGLGRPEPKLSGGATKSCNSGEQQSNSATNEAKGIPPPTRRRESSLTRDNTKTFMQSARDHLLNRGNRLYL